MSQFVVYVTNTFTLATFSFGSFKKKLPPALKNRYFITLLVFIGWIVFVDRHDVLTQIRLWRSERRLKNEIAGYKDKIKEAQNNNNDLKQNKEKYARELYYMHRPEEDVFVIEEPN